METFLSVCVGMGLAAACGFRVFVPFLAASLAARSGLLTLSPGFEWLGSWPALIAFAVATAVEIAAYYVPWLDNLLDALATPAAVVAGVVLTAAAVGDVSPFLKWTLAVIAGGGAAGLVQGVTGLTRHTSTLATAGLGNPLVATGEMVGSTLFSLLAILMPVAAVALLLGFVYLAFRLIRRFRRPRMDGLGTSRA